MYIYCTLFDSNYLDKGIVLYNSLVNIGDDFHLFIFAFDDMAYDILSDMKLKYCTIISMKEFENNELLKVKPLRTRAEYCWTCTPQIIEFVLRNYNNIRICTYIDADMMFFSSARSCFDEMLAKNASVMITPHRFPNSIKGRTWEKRAGRYCVEFNAFRNDEFGMSALLWWKQRCLESCRYSRNGEILGDQGYLNDWMTRFNHVCELENWGAGLAPWNIGQCSYFHNNEDKNIISFKTKYSDKLYKLIFYHFQNIRYITKNLININVGPADKILKDSIYTSYICQIFSMQNFLILNYGLKINHIKSTSSNIILQYIQKYLVKYRIHTFDDLYNINRVTKG